MFTTLRRRVALKIQAHTSKVKVINRGQRSYWGHLSLYCDPTLVLFGIYVACSNSRLVRFWLCQNLTNLELEYEIDLRLKKFYNHRPRRLQFTHLTKATTRGSCMASQRDSRSSVHCWPSCSQTRVPARCTSRCCWWTPASTRWVVAAPE